MDDNKMLEYLVYSKAEQYEALKENMDLVNIKCHDMKQQISLYANRMNSDALEEIKDLIQVFETPFQTGNDVLDTFFAEKSLSIKKAGIHFNCIIDGVCLRFIKPSDIYALFGNAFDNAVEALTKVPKEYKILTVSVKKKMNMVIIHFENYYQDKITFSDGLPVTSKKNTDYHGFGMRSIRLIAEKYGGNMTVGTEHGIFNLNVLIPIPNQ